MNPWTASRVGELYELAFNELIFRAHSTHRQHFDPNAIQLSTLLSIKTGGCSEDCGYCPQSARHDTGVANEPLFRWKRSSPRQRPRRKTAPRDSAWARPGAGRSSATSTSC
jgi:biotin synthase-like enzyme